jgi:6-phosphogluconolactonase (cycloisomerase 2 family)
MGCVTGRLATLVAVAGLLFVLAPPPAHAWTDACCLPWGQYLSQPAITPDGRFAYASDGYVVLALARNPDTGELGVIDSYTAHAGGTLELSPDGRTLYVVAFQYATIAEFSRDESTGKLTPIGEYDSGKPALTGGRYRDIAFSSDGRTAYLTYGDIVETAPRDPDTGLLAYRSEVQAHAPSALELSPDDRFLYVRQGSDDPLLVLARGDDGSLTQVQTVDAPYASDLVLSPDGKRLYTGPERLTTYDRDPTTGMLTLVGTATGGVSATGLPDGEIAATADSLYVLDHSGHHLLQYATSSDGLRFVRTYRENADGQGLRNPSGLSVSPDGAFLYVDGRPGTPYPGEVAAFRRDAGSGALSFSSLYVGPIFDGHAPWDVTPPKVVINGGAEYTNDPDVTLTITGITWPTAFVMQVSNDGGFGPESSEWIPVTAGGNTYNWTLASSGPERLAKTVYVRARIHTDFEVTSDEIVLDQRPPELLSVAQVGRSLRIRARDRLSGLKQLQLTHDRRKPGRWRAYQARLSVARSRRPLYVRVRDGAGNRSRWVAARGKR